MGLFVQPRKKGEILLCGENEKGDSRYPGERLDHVSKSETGVDVHKITAFYEKVTSRKTRKRNKKKVKKSICSPLSHRSRAKRSNRSVRRIYQKKIVRHKRQEIRGGETVYRDVKKASPNWAREFARESLEGAGRGGPKHQERGGRNRRISPRPRESSPRIKLRITSGVLG